ncbi:MAG: hydantoinase B/oxoprolinase family protein [Gaiellaceae bacterium]
MTAKTTQPDPITLEIIQNSLPAISDEMFGVMRKTAMSAIIYEVLDMGTGITDGHGNLVGRASLPVTLFTTMAVKDPDEASDSFSD